jgi:hypothetical protein
LRYREGWSFELKDIERDHADVHSGAAGGLTFIGITGDYGGLYFYFPVPAATFNRASWLRWLFDRILDVERHEAMEHFAIEETDDSYDLYEPCVECGHRATRHDGRDNSCNDCTLDEGHRHRFAPSNVKRITVRPFAPTHGPGDDPYVVHDYADDLQRRTAFTGKAKAD